MGNALISFLFICIACAVPVALVVFAFRQKGSPYSAPAMRTSWANLSSRTVAALAAEQPMEEPTEEPAAQPTQQPAPAYVPAPQRRRRSWAVSLNRRPVHHRAPSLHAPS